MNTKYIFVTGGVVSSLGKGVSVAAIGALLQNKGFKVRLKKLDPYLNVDPGTLNPYEHGEVFITADGGETDLDLGHYERFTGVKSSRNDNTTSGKIYQNVINAERKGEYLGKTVQVIPHVTDEIKKFILSGNEGYDFVICEIGGTIGDIESLPFLEAIRQIKFTSDPNSTMNLHLTLLPFIDVASEIKTKPTQHSVKTLLSIGIQADFLICRTKIQISDDVKEKIAHFCNVNMERIITAVDTNCIYNIPILYKNQKLDDQILKFFNISERKDDDLKDFRNFVTKYNSPKREINIGIFGKYTDFKDSYKSLCEAIVNTGVEIGAKANVVLINSEELKDDDFENINGVIVPGGFGKRGVNGKINAIRYAREHDIPFLGICFGMQLMAIEFARNVLGLKNANSTEFDENTDVPVIDILKLTKDKENLGGTMRLGEMICNIKPGSKLHSIYNQNVVRERFRHRFGFRDEYCELFEKHGAVFSSFAIDEDTNQKIIESIELPSKKWFVGVQYHPEFSSTPLNPSPLFKSFLEAALDFESIFKIAI